MKRRTFLLGAGGAAVGGTALVGTGAFTGAEATRAASITVQGDKSAYLGLQKMEDSPNAGYVTYNDQGALELRMDGENPAEGGGTGVNPDGYSYFDNLFQIVNQGTQKALVVLAKFGDHANSVQFYNSETLAPIESPKLGVGESIPVGLETTTTDLGKGAQLLDEMFVLGTGIGGGAAQQDAQTMVADSTIPEGAIPNTKYDGRSRTDG